MGKAGKKRRSLIKQMAKRAAKEARKREYEQMALSGNNSKGRTKRRSGVKTLTHSHASGSCGNLACRKCFPVQNTIWDKYRSWPIREKSCRAT